MQMNRIGGFLRVGLSAGMQGLLCFCLSQSFTPAVHAAIEVEKVWQSGNDFERCVWDKNTAMTARDSFVLAKSVLFQDEDGCTHYANTETLGGLSCAKKLFVLDDPKCDGARLFAYYGAGLQVSCNGNALPGPQPLPDTAWTFWDIPPGLLKRGSNEFVFTGTGTDTLIIDHSIFPNRSAKSIDGGKTWDFEHLGRNNDNGEYLVRLRLVRYPAEGIITSEVISLPSLCAETPILPTLTAVKKLALSIEGAAGKSGSLSCEWRAGTRPSYDPASWSAWQRCRSGRPLDLASVAPKLPSYLQWRVTLKSAGPLSTPELKSVRLNASLAVAEAHAAMPTLKVTEFTPVRSVKSSIRFAYQAADGRASVLRTRYELDKVISGGKTELERIVLLREWVRSRAPNGWDWGSARYVPPWDALLILETQLQPIALCMCTHYSTVFTQCALSLGYTARQVILDHHCVAEIWSDQFHKWILMDTGNSEDPTLNCHFETNGIPLNAVEIRDLWTAGNTGVIDVVYTPPRNPVKGTAINPNQCGFKQYRRFAIPLRNNFLGNPVPGEPEQGESAYYCDQYLWFEAGAVPTESPEYGKTSCRRDDFYWTLNETVVELGRTQEPGVLRVTLNNSVPNFARYLVSADGGAWEEKPGSFDWTLHPGRNVLAAKSVNTFGLECPTNTTVMDVPESH